MQGVIGPGWGDLLLPRSCPVCDAALVECGISTCAACALAVTAAVAKPYCELCGLSVGPFLCVEGRCPSCVNKRPPYERLVRVGAYEGVLQKTILRFKAGGRAMIGEMLGGFLASAAMSVVAGKVQMLTTIPTHWSRAIFRAYRPSALIAQHLARSLGLPFVPLLRATRRTQEQKRLPLSLRAGNVKGAFAVAHREQLAGVTALLVDDVFTSGETIREASRVLRNAGANGVIAAVAAVSEPLRERAT